MGCRVKCFLCNRGFSTPGRFMHHAVSVHGCSRVALERVISQAQGGALVLVGTRRGRVMVMIQAPLL